MEYTADKIQVLEDHIAVRKRPGMYIGSTDERGLHHLIFEVVDNSIDEAVAGYCKNIHVVIHEDGSVSVEDDGRGIPTEEHPVYKKSALEIVMTMLHSGAKFDHKTYKVSGGLHGVGVHVVNALSEWMKVYVKRNGKVYYQSYSRGRPLTKVMVVGRVNDGKIITDHNVIFKENSPTGTLVWFKPDKEIFSDTTISYDYVRRRLRDLAFLNSGIRITLEDKRTGKKEEFLHEGGIVEFVRYLNEGHNVLHRDVIHIKGEINGVQVEAAIQYNDSSSENMLSFVNNIQTVEGGTHVTGFRIALTKVINEVAKKLNLLKNVKSLSGEDVREGLTAVLHVKVPEPQFEGQTKAKLGNSEVRGIVQSIIYDSLQRYFEIHQNTAAIIAERAVRAAYAREMAKRAREMAKRKTFLDSLDLPGKLADCTTQNPAKAELFIVEGDSAGGNAKQARDRRFQAILPLRGKILNVEKASMDKIFKNKEIRALISAIGTGIKDDFDYSKLRYHKIIIMTDADVDGAHIRTLLLTFFYRYMFELVAKGHIYVVQPPLYRIQKGKEIYYVYSDDEKNKLLEELGKNVIVQRFKGLGEMNPQQLWETTMNPETRKIVQITVEDAVEADRLFSILMGEQVEPRKEFILRHAREVRNLDV